MKEYVSDYGFSNQGGEIIPNCHGIKLDSPRGWKIFNIDKFLWFICIYCHKPCTPIQKSSQNIPQGGDEHE